MCENRGEGSVLVASGGCTHHLWLGMRLAFCMQKAKPKQERVFKANAKTWEQIQSVALAGSVNLTHFHCLICHSLAKAEGGWCSGVS